MHLTTNYLRCCKYKAKYLSYSTIVTTIFINHYGFGIKLVVPPLNFAENFIESLPENTYFTCGLTFNLHHCKPKYTTHGCIRDKQCKSFITCTSGVTTIEICILTLQGMLQTILVHINCQLSHWCTTFKYVILLPIKLRVINFVNEVLVFLVSSLLQYTNCFQGVFIWVPFLGDFSLLGPYISIRVAWLFSVPL